MLFSSLCLSPLANLYFPVSNQAYPQVLCASSWSNVWLQKPLTGRMRTRYSHNGGDTIRIKRGGVEPVSPLIRFPRKVVHASLLVSDAELDFGGMGKFRMKVIRFSHGFLCL